MTEKSEAINKLLSIALDPSQDWAKRWQILQSSDLPSEAVAKAAMQIASNPTEDWYLRNLALAHKAVDPRGMVPIAGQIAADPDEVEQLKETALKNPHLPAEVLSAVALDSNEWWTVRQLALSHPNIPASVAAQVACNPKEDSDLRAEVVASVRLARLVSAAPELLQACEMALYSMAQGGVSSEAVEALRAAVAKAQD